jgi:CheY-like chemotaxis protein
MPQQPSILLIEDEANLRHNLGVLLQGEGYRVVSAEDGAEGISKLREEPFDLVITDVVMPEVDGFQVMEYVNAHTPNVVVVAITAYVSTDSAIQALRRGAYDYLAKPFDVDLMHLVIKRALEKARMQKAFQRYTAELERRLEEYTRYLVEANISLEQSNEALRAMQEQLAQTEGFCALGEVMASVSPELGDSLATIVGFTQMLARTTPAESGMKPQLERIGDMAFRCHEIVQKLATFPSHPAREKVQTHLSAVCEDMLAELPQQADLRHIAIERRLDAGLPSIMADPHRLLRAFTHIALYGCRAIASNGAEGRLAVETKWGQEAVLQVLFRVDGLGVTGGRYGALHDPFLTIRDHAGRLGLRLAYEMIREQGGKMAVHTIPGEGATYVVDFPIHDNLPSTAMLPSSGWEIAERQRVLVVDAEEENLVLLQEVLHHLGHEAERGSSAQEALQKIADRNYDLIITDMHLPGMDGLCFYQQVKELRPELAQRVIFISGGLLSDEIGAFSGRVGCPLIKKPFSVADIEMGMRQVLTV